MKELPRFIDSGFWNTGHCQGIAVDLEKGFVYYSFTTMLIKTDLQGRLVGTVSGLLGHLGCIDFCEGDGRVYGSLLDGLLGGELAPGLTRQVAFGGLGGCGTVRCFHPDHVWICRGGQLIPAPEIWVAVYPGRIPGMQRALAPPSFAIIPGKYEFQ